MAPSEDEKFEDLENMHKIRQNRFNGNVPTHEMCIKCKTNWNNSIKESAAMSFGIIWPNTKKICSYMFVSFSHIFLSQK